MVDGDGRPLQPGISITLEQPAKSFARVSRIASTSFSFRGATNRKDPVRFRVAIPAADPPDNITHDRYSVPQRRCHVI
ncbi:hypothetical protein F1C10_13700 [Sphingomonas sp. NBWT7]|nr:hypothetical protein F1C10_13700 [Sphingomonas sp. NBWT7]